MKKRIAAAAAFCLVLGTVGVLGTAAEEYSFDYDMIEKLYYEGDTAPALGDVTQDSVIDGRDATFVLTDYAAVSAGKESTLTAEQLVSADVNKDSTVDGRDATTILSYYAVQSAGTTVTLEKYIANIKSDSVLSTMRLHDKVCQMFIVRPENLAGDTEMKAATLATETALKQNPVGGFIYFTRNLESADQVKSMISTTKQYAANAGKVPLFYGVDEEGGAVSRCAEALGTVAFEPMYNYKSKGPFGAYGNARKLAYDISQFGFNLDFAPVADTWSNHENTVIGTRAYSDDFEETAMLVGAAVRGFDEGGVYCTLKHFPGHGNTAEDSHDGSAISNRTAEELQANEYIAFQRGIDAGADMVMVGHITVPSIDTMPASLSKKIVEGQLRGVLGYDGVVVTDALGMGAVANAYSSAESAALAVDAGCDMLLDPKNLNEAIEGIENAVRVGTISEERIDQSVKRILMLKCKHMDIDN